VDYFESMNAVLYQELISLLLLSHQFTRSQRACLPLPPPTHLHAKPTGTL
jgi:hypothetical protein